MRKISFWLLWMFVLSIPMENVTSLNGVGTISKLLGVIALAATVMAVIMEGGLRRTTRVLALLTAYVVWSGVSLLWSSDVEMTLHRFWVYAQLLMIVWVIWECAADPARHDGLLAAYVLGAVIATCGTIYSYHSGSSHMGDEGRYAGMGFDPNDQCVELAIGIPIACFLRSRAFPAAGSWLWLLAVPFLAFGCILTGSRGGLLALCAASLMIPMSMKTVPRSQRVIGSLMLATGVLCAALMMPQTSTERYAQILQQIQDGDMTGRGDIWRAGLQLIPGHWFTGVGAGAFPSAVSVYLGYTIVAHNTFLTVLVELGIVGLSLFIASWGELLFSLRAMASPQKRLWTVVFLTWLVGVSALSWDYAKPTWFLLGMFLAQSAYASVGSSPGKPVTSDEPGREYAYARSGR